MSEILILKGGLLIDGNGGPPISDPEITIEGGRITAVDSNAGGTKASSARLADCGDCTLMAGLMDLHVHLSCANSADYEQSGAAA
ncbi:MAG: hypothetical protein HOI95_04090 [Chromatiales bacterium]|jgi:dihydroorotase-like cyclic amidohydrolase|nr:hypothetical protein [Chromatiales bacterium]